MHLFRRIPVFLVLIGIYMETSALSPFISQLSSSPINQLDEEPSYNVPIHVRLYKPQNQDQSQLPWKPLNINLLRYLSQNNYPQKPLTFPESQTQQPFIQRPAATPSLLPAYNYNIKRKSTKKICLPEECDCNSATANENTFSNFQPVCGSDWVTYGNQCLLECSKTCKPDLVKYHNGYCGKPFTVQVQSQKKSSSSCLLGNDCNCPDAYDDDGLQLRNPVCGTDGVTYGNRCLLECDRDCNPNLQFSHAGYCGRLFYPV